MSRFGSDIKQFCSNMCLEDYKKGLKVCSYCQKDISGNLNLDKIAIFVIGNLIYPPPALS